MNTISQEQRQAIEHAGGQPIRLEDPENHCLYVLLKEDQYERSMPGGGKLAATTEIPEGIRRAQEAFFRDLPSLLNDETLRGQWVGYVGRERIGISDTDEPLIRECLRRGLKREEYDLFVIRPQSPEPEEVDYPSAWR